MTAPTHPMPRPLSVAPEVMTRLPDTNVEVYHRDNHAMTIWYRIVDTPDPNQETTT